MKKLAMFLFLFTLTLSARGETVSPTADMRMLAKEISALQKYLLSDSSFKSLMNDEAIRKSLDTMSSHLSHLDKSSFNNDPALKANVNLLEQHITDAGRAFKENNKAYARMMLKSSLQMCIACHTRVKTADLPFPTVDLEGATLLEKAEFLFATRQFENGKLIFESMVDGYPKNKVSSWELRQALLSLAVFYARVKETPAAGAEYFQKISTKGEFPSYLKKELNEWARELQSWAKEKESKDNTNLTETQLLEKAKKLLKYDDFSILSNGSRNFHIRRLRASSILHHVLEAPGAQSPAKGEALLYLGQIYHRVSSNLFFRFGEMYLKACIQEYKKTKVSRDCYSALESAVKEGYTGSAGTHIPEDEQAELFRLKRLAF